MTSNIVLGELMIFCTEDRDFRIETEGGSLIPHCVCFFTYTDITETVIYVMLILTNGSMHTLDSMVKGI